MAGAPRPLWEPIEWCCQLQVPQAWTTSWEKNDILVWGQSLLGHGDFQQVYLDHRGGAMMPEGEARIFKGNWVGVLTSEEHRMENRNHVCQERCRERLPFTSRSARGLIMMVEVQIDLNSRESWQMTSNRWSWWLTLIVPDCGLHPQYTIAYLIFIILFVA